MYWINFNDLHFTVICFIADFKNGNIGKSAVGKPIGEKLRAPTDLDTKQMSLGCFKDNKNVLGFAIVWILKGKGILLISHQIQEFSVLPH